MRRDIVVPGIKFSLRREPVTRKEHAHREYSLRREPVMRNGHGHWYEHEHEHEHRHMLAKLMTVGGALLAGYACYKMIPDLQRYMHIRNM
jgi:hypothetical protein